MIHDLVTKPKLDHNSKYLVLTTKNDIIVNFAILFEESGEIFVDFNNNPGTALRLSSIDDQTIRKIYPNHLKDLKGHQHLILIARELEKVIIKNGKLCSAPVHFLNIIQEVENSKIVFGMLDGPLDQILKQYVDLYYDRRFHMTLNTIFHPEHIAPSLMTYEETGYCSLVPEKVAMSFSLSKVKNRKNLIEKYLICL